MMATAYDVQIDSTQFNVPFLAFIEKNFGKLSASNSRTSPVIVSRAMEYMHDHSEKFVVIVMDGMSEFDWHIIKSTFEGIRYSKTKYLLIEYPKYYLSKEYDYLICGIGSSFDSKGEKVMSHGGISIDEVIVPSSKTVP